MQELDVFRDYLLRIYVSVTADKTIQTSDKTMGRPGQCVP